MNTAPWALNQPHRGEAPVAVRRGGGTLGKGMAYWALFVALYAILFSFWQREPVPADVHLLAIAVAATCALPFAAWYARGMPGIPMFELICLSYALQFSTPVYTQPRSLFILSRQVLFTWDDVVQTLALVELGVVALLAGFYYRPLTGLWPRVDLPLDPERYGTYLKGAILVGGGLMVLQRLGWSPLGRIPAFGAISALVTNQVNIAMVLLTYEVYRRGAPLRRRLLLYGLVGGLAVLGLLSGMMGDAFNPLVLFVLARWPAARKTPFRLLLLGAALFVLLNPIKLQYRNMTWWGRGAEYGTLGRLGLWIDLAGDAVGEMASAESWAQNEATVRDAMSRFNLLYKFTHVRRMTPDIVPYYGGQTYEYLLAGWVPRLFWPGKPSASDANHRMDIDYGFVYEFQARRGTNIAIGQLAEAYANFGVLGIAIAMLLQGILFGALNRVFNGPGSEGGRAIYATLLLAFLNGVGTSTAMAFGALFQHMLANAVLLRVLVAQNWTGDDRSGEQ